MLSQSERPTGKYLSACVFSELLRVTASPPGRSLCGDARFMFIFPGIPVIRYADHGRLTGNVEGDSCGGSSVEEFTVGR